MGWLAARLKAQRGVTCTYSRGATTKTYTVTLGRTEFTLRDGRTEFSDQDIVMTAADFDLGEPTRGDEFRLTIGSATRVHAVLSPDGQKVWRNDASGKLLRIHGKWINTE